MRWFMCDRTTTPRGAVKSTRLPFLSDHGTVKSASLADVRASRASRTCLSNSPRSVSVVSKLYPDDVAKLTSVSRSVCVSQPGIVATSCARCPNGNDFGCGFHGRHVCFSGFQHFSHRGNLGTEAQSARQIDADAGVNVPLCRQNGRTDG